MLTISAGMLFSVIRGLWDLWHSDGDSALDLIERLQKRLNAAASVTALAGFHLALAT
jgi:hypothetical protein